MVTSASMPSHGTLPIVRTRLIGREVERAAARTFLVEEAAPLLTLTGPGGVGKTRLAIAVAEDVAHAFADGVLWVDLAPVTDSALIATAVARAIGLTPIPEQPVAHDVARVLRPCQLLLLLDNCEHLIAAIADLVAGLLTACPAVQVLATSRAPLRVRGEQMLPVEPLALPDLNAPLATIAETDAVRLFVTRVRTVHPSFCLDASNVAVVGILCRHLDGLPLALELAAAHGAVLSPAALLAQMTDRLRLLSSGARDLPDRQQTMNATIAWSYDLLTHEEQAAFRGLVVFTGGWTLEAAAAVLEKDEGETLTLLERLVAHSLVRAGAEPDGPRFTMLETIRAFGLVHLRDSGEATETRRRHAAYFLQLVHKLDAYWAPFMPNPQQILDQLAVEQPNLQTALAWCREDGEIDHLLELAGSLYFFWQLRGQIREGRRWLEWGLSQPARVSSQARSAGQTALAGILFQQAEFARALYLCDESIRLSEEIGYAVGIVHACECAALPAINSGQLDRATSYLDRAVASLETLGDLPWVERLISHLQTHYGGIALLQGNFAKAHRIYADLVAVQGALARDSRAASPYACWPLHRLGVIETILGDPVRGLSHLQAAIEHAWQFHEHACVAASTMSVARLLATHERWREAAQLFGAAEAFCEQSGYHFWEDFWPWERIYGLPEPWQQADESLGAYQRMREAVVAAGWQPAPPLPDADAAEQIWATGRGMPIEEAVAQALAVDLSSPPLDGSVPIAHAAGSQANGKLSARERDVLVLLCQRLTDPQIAEHLFLSPRTVESHVASLLRKLDAANRREAVAAAARLGLISLAQSQASPL